MSEWYRRGIGLNWVAVIVFGLIVAGAVSVTKLPASESMRVYVGTYTQDGSRGIYLFTLDLATGKLSPGGVVGEVANPSFLAIHPNRRFLYAVNEVGRFAGKRSGAVSAFSLEPATGKLTLLNQQSSEGTGPCYVTIDRSGKNALVANYGGGSVAVLPISGDGRLKPATAAIQHTGSSVDRGRQDAPHAHSINVDPDNRFAIAADLGLDKLFVYRFDAAKGTLVPNDPPATKVAPGAGPRHFAFHPSGRFGYVINEMGSSVTALAYDAERGVLRELQTIGTLPAGFTGANTTAEVQVHPSGKFLYGSNRGHDSIAIFTIDPTTGRLKAAGHQPTQGKMPRNFGIDPAGHYLLAANQDSGSIVVFRIDAETGRLDPTGNLVNVPKPVCVKLLPAGGGN